VEPPGTAPGSDPLITSAFIAIVREDMAKVGKRRRVFNPLGAGGALGYG